MPLNPKSSKKKPCTTPKPIPQHQGLLTQALSFHSNGDSDDDFQNPSSVVRPSSLRKTASSQPPEPCKVSRPEKKPRFARSSGRQSAPIEEMGVVSRVCSTVPGDQDLDSRPSCRFPEGCDEKEEILSPVEQKFVVDLSSNFCWSSLDFPITETPLITPRYACLLSPEFDENGGNVPDSSPVELQTVQNSIEPNLVDSDQIPMFSNDGFNQPLDFSFEQSRKLKLIEKSPNEKNKLDANLKGQYHLKSIESKLVESGSKSEMPKNDFDFEDSTQLNELMNCCLELGIEMDNSIGANLLIECPLCGFDLSDLSEESRQLHTNDCLDKSEISEEPGSICDTKSNLAQENVGKNSVIEWLKNLGLCKYEEIFVKEEIDWDTLKFLTEEDLLNIGITSIGSRKKIMNALSELHNKNNDDNTPLGVTNSFACKKANTPLGGNKLITQYFIGSGSNPNRNLSLKKPIKKNIVTNITSKKNSTKKGTTNKRAVRDIPSWCCVPGTPFRVDAFKFLGGGCSHWFLTHFHMDHYQGLTKKFCHGKIYCSAITARLVSLKIGVPMDMISILPLNEKINIGGVNVYCFDANHCPGSLILLFEPPNGNVVLHTGDFRFSSDVGNNSILQKFRVDTLILDTTYCNPQYDFPKQEAVVQFVIEAIQAEAFNPKTLFLIGSYTIGKERVFLEVARVLKKKIYVAAAKLSILRCLELPQEQMQWLTSNETESNIHVVPMWSLASFKRMKHISNQYAGQYDLIVAFSPTGWSFGKGTKKANGRRWQQGTIIRYEVPYSEHSSFSELREFVRLINPEHIIPSVNNNGPQSADSMRSLLLTDL